MPIVFNPETDPVYKEGIEQGLQLGLQQGIQKARLEDAKILIKDFNIPIEAVSKKLNISIEEIKKHLY